MHKTQLHQFPSNTKFSIDKGFLLKQWNNVSFEHVSKDNLYSRVVQETAQTWQSAHCIAAIHLTSKKAHLSPMIKLFNLFQGKNV